MASTEKNVTVTKQSAPPSSLFDWHPFESLKRQVDHLFEEFPASRTLGEFQPFDRLVAGWPTTPPVDFVERDAEYEISAELPGLDEKSVDVKLANGVLSISGEKKEEKEEKKEGYYFSERRYGSFRRAFRVPEGVDADKISAAFEKGVLKVRLPKSPEAKEAEKKIEIASK